MAYQPLIMPAHWYFLVIILPVFAYALMLILFSVTLLLPQNNRSENSEPVNVSVIVAARNEAENLPLLLTDLSRQNYPKHLLEIIVVDDHSEIPVRSLLIPNNRNLEKVKVLELEQGIEGKKQALRKGTMEAASDLLLFTDADCRLPAGWVREHVNASLKTGSTMNIGLTRYSSCKTILQIFYYLDIVGLNLCSAAAAQLKHPVMCSGANLSVNRDLYLQLAEKLKMHLPSGDDVFLLHEMKKIKGARIQLLRNRNSIITTIFPSTLREFMDQRSRWISKSRYYSVYF